ncbi:MAG: S1 RNA-binding domain-containing protein [Acidobacteriota bacterium]
MANGSEQNSTGEMGATTATHAPAPEIHAAPPQVKIPPASAGRDEAKPGRGADLSSPAPSPPATGATQAESILSRAHRKGLVVEGKVVAIVRGGYEIAVHGLIALCPFSQIDLRLPGDQLAHLHQTYEFLVTSCKRGGRRVVLSRRRVLERKARQAQRKARARIKPGMEMDARVTSLTRFGAFVDLGLVQGMIHLSEITHARIQHPSERLEVGQTARVRVLKSDPHKGRISLSMKALEEDPWKGIASRLPLHTVATGRLLRLTAFGAFVEVAPGVDGLIHISEIPEALKGTLEEKAKKRATLDVVVLKIEPDKKRMALAPAPEGLKPGDKVVLQSLRPGRLVEARVQEADRKEILVRIGPGQSGVIPAVESGAARDADLGRLFPPGKELRALVLGSDRGERRVRLSIKRAERREERRQLEQYKKSAASGAGAFATLGDFFGKD